MSFLSRIFPPSRVTRLQTEREQWLRVPGLSYALKQLLEAPLPDFNATVTHLPWLVFDFETSGLDANTDCILSIGSVVAENGQIGLASAQHHYISSGNPVNARSAIINHITPEMLRDGVALDKAMEALFTSLTGRVAVVHGRMVERAFINAWLFKRYGREGLPLLWIDTLELERRHQQAARRIQNDLRLSSIRRDYHLPDYPAHHALCDAVATAEVLLAQIGARSHGHDLLLNAFLCD
ncbi:exonuclease domain-containing protein [Buttiauxella noackiae]|uniref:exonuclease domain-containing protein n=1 Tax=Buttiauxella noackiae TaxID=82992 RepID=UPI0035A5BBFA